MAKPNNALVFLLWKNKKDLGFDFPDDDYEQDAAFDDRHVEEDPVDYVDDTTETLLLKAEGKISILEVH